MPASLGLSKDSSLTSWLDWQEKLHSKEIDLGLERVRGVYQDLSKLGSANKIFTISVAGTNGKGSCVALLESILLAAGYSVGCYTTPHILSYNERVRVNGEAVPDSDLVTSFELINHVRKETSLSYFEFGTLAALEIFKQKQVDVQILEVGLGGRLDAVNIVDADAALVSSIDIDHIDWLGDDRSQIAVEKAGIFRAKQKAVCGDMNCPDSLVDVARSLKTDLLMAGVDYSVQVGDKNWLLASDKFLAFAGEYPLPSLKGEHQIHNAAAVINLLAHTNSLLPVTKADIVKGLGAANLAGRLQLINGSPTVLIDVAHNPQAARVLAHHISNELEFDNIYAVFSVLNDKELGGVITPLADIVKRWYIAPVESVRSQSLENISKTIADHSLARCFKFKSIYEAFDQARTDADKNDLIVCFGSFLVVEACLGGL
ncbi:MAG: bifunctional folylpolyglutamate synthase/ dihydrofolate synthase [Cycloclasticus sp. symbiont of Poecilosclerida sp. M]|nr:MAG: bifunctional folylpolyglutamate synthase/ dihydrofolate synthase [Cycloclasticus sp. symbiont of Poecilosclerida sp. M]